MAKIGGYKTIVELIRSENNKRDNSRRFLHISTISEHTGISEERLGRILNRPSNSGIFRMSRGRRPDVWTLIELD